ncbi:hypothetical protein [Marmoricola sp. RAF53]|uniref:hypothetical protein n=1 Tax=Marmoricola sp. RAF53 TaxID=3233059 RepID=UPI003F948F8F
MTIQHTQSIPAVQAHPAPQVLPRAGSRDGTAPLRSNPQATLHLVLFIAGAVLLPAGLIVIGLGWYGVAHTPYVYDQNAYIVSGGILGLGITFAGGFLYFSSWLARIAADQKDAQRQLSETLLLLADAVSHNTAMAEQVQQAPVANGNGANGGNGGVRAAAAPPRPRDAGAVLVVAGNGTTVHRADCDLVAGRDDLRPAGPDAPGLTPCRLCRQ